MDIEIAKEIIIDNNKFQLEGYFYDKPEFAVITKLIDKAYSVVYDNLCEVANVCPICGSNKSTQCIKVVDDYRDPSMVKDILFLGCSNSDCEYNKQQAEIRSQEDLSRWSGYIK